MTDKTKYPTDYSAVYIPKYNLLIPKKIADLMMAYIEDREQNRRHMRVTATKLYQTFRDWLKETYPHRKIPIKSALWYSVGSIEFKKAVLVKAKDLYEIEITEPEPLTKKQEETIYEEAIKQGIILPKETKIQEAEELKPREVEGVELIAEEVEEALPEKPTEKPMIEIYTIGFTFRVGAEYSPRKQGGKGKGDIDIEAEIRISVDVPKELWENPTIRDKIIEDVTDAVNSATDEFFERDYAVKYVFESIGKDYMLEPQLERWDIDDHFTVEAEPTEIKYSADVDYVNFARANRIGEPRTKRPYYASRLLDKTESKLIDVESIISSYVSKYYGKR